MIYLALALVLLGVLIGSAGMKRLGRVAWRTWRPGAALLAIACLAGGALLMVRGVEWEGALVIAAGVGLSVFARRRAPRPNIGPGPAVGTMGRREAASILGVAIDASPAEAEAAYRRLIRLAHPDHGGSPGLAAQLNLARAVLAKPAA